MSEPVLWILEAVYSTPENSALTHISPGNI